MLYTEGLVRNNTGSSVSTAPFLVAATIFPIPSGIPKILSEKSASFPASAGVILFVQIQLKRAQIDFMHRRKCPMLLIQYSS